LPPNEWESKKLASKAIWPRAGFQLLSRNVGGELISTLETTEYAIPTPKISIVKEKTGELVTAPKKQREAPLSHTELQQKLVEIVEMQGYLAESEYSFDTGKLDVVWRRVLNSVPTYVFEVK
jgi:hypothetical protein